MILQTLDAREMSCLAFTSWSHAQSCVSLIQTRLPGAPASVFAVSVQGEEESVRVGAGPIYAVVYKTSFHEAALTFWRLTGTGISSRHAEEFGERLQDRKQLAVKPVYGQPLLSSRKSKIEDSASLAIKDRICHLLQRASRRPDVADNVSSSHVSLYPTGMSAIYHCCRLLNAWRPSICLAFGFLYELTPKLLESYSTSFRFYGFGNEEELDQLELLVKSHHDSGRSVQSVWCECPSNPLLHTVNFTRLRALADLYGFLIVIDDTIGTFANVDLLPIADILVTSLTKSFSGEANVMGGSLTLNSKSIFYTDLSKRLERAYVPELHPLDAKILEFNSRDFLPRIATMNQTAYYLVTLLSTFAANPSSVITRIFHPSVLPSRSSYDKHMRHSTPHFVPGHGGLFTIEFVNENAACIFFNALDIHKGPSLGACVTLAQPYVQTVFALEKEWAASYGLSDTIVRISVGLEDPRSLGRAFRKAFGMASWALKGWDEQVHGVCV